MVEKIENQVENKSSNEAEAEEIIGDAVIDDKQEKKENEVLGEIDRLDD